MGERRGIGWGSASIIFAAFIFKLIDLFFKRTLFNELLKLLFRFIEKLGIKYLIFIFKNVRSTYCKLEVFNRTR